MSDRGPRVLVVDDEPPIRRFLRTSLANHGYDVFEAVDGREALTAVTVHRLTWSSSTWGCPTWMASK